MALLVCRELNRSMAINMDKDKVFMGYSPLLQ